MDITKDKDQKTNRNVGNESAQSTSSLDTASIRDTSGTPDLLRNVKCLREKINRWESAAQSTSDVVTHRLIRATDDYTDLLRRRPRFEDGDFEQHSNSSSIGGSMRNHHDSSKRVVKEDLFEDDDFRNALDKLTQRMHHMESTTGARTASKHLKDQSASAASWAHLPKSRSFADNLLTSGNNDRSDVERKRGAALLAPSIRDIFDDDEPTIRHPLRFSSPKSQIDLLDDRQAKQSNIHQQQQQNSSNDRRTQTRQDISTGNNEKDEGGDRLNRSRLSLTSSASSLRPLNDVQMSKLKEFQESLKRDMERSRIENHSSQNRNSHGEPSAVDRSKHSVNEKLLRQSAAEFNGMKSQPMDLDQSRQSLQNELERSRQQLFGNSSSKRSIDLEHHHESQRRSTTSKPIVPPLILNSTIGHSINGHRGRSPLKHGIIDGATQTSFLVANAFRSAPGLDKSAHTKFRNRPRIQLKRSSSVPASPMRHGSARGFGFETRAPPFVAGKSLGPSHSIFVNLQQLFALLKVQNPSLYQACRNLEQGVQSVTSLADMFQKELAKLLRKRKNELKELLIAYDKLVTISKSEPMSSDVSKRLKKLAHTMEMKDTEIQRLRGQYEKLVKLREDARSMEQSVRPCQLIQIVTAGFFDSNQSSNVQTKNFAKPTTSTMMKSINIVAPISARWRSKSVGRSNEESIQALRDMKMLSSVMGKSRGMVGELY